MADNISGFVIYSLAMTIDMGVIPHINKVSFSLMNIAFSIDKGIIPPRNYFQSQVNTLAIFLEKADEAILIYEIM